MVSSPRTLSIPEAIDGDFFPPSSRCGPFLCMSGPPANGRLAPPGAVGKWLCPTAQHLAKSGSCGSVDGGGADCSGGVAAFAEENVGAVVQVALPRERWCPSSRLPSRGKAGCLWIRLPERWVSARDPAYGKMGVCDDPATGKVGVYDPALDPAAGWVGVGDPAPERVGVCDPALDPAPGKVGVCDRAPGKVGVRAPTKRCVSAIRHGKVGVCSPGRL